MTGRLKIIPHEKIPASPGHHSRSMLMMAVICAVCGGPAVICHFIMGIEANWWMGAPVFLAPVLFLVLALRRSLNAKCPDCRRPMQRRETVLVIEPHMLWGKYNCPPWTVFHCRHCDTSWRVPAIKLGEGGHRITEEERRRIINAERTDTDG